MREAQRDALMIADLAADCVEKKIDEQSLREICKEIRQEATVDNPYLPPTGSILNRLVMRMQYRKSSEPTKREPARAAPAGPNRRIVPWAFKNYSQISENEFAQLRVHMASFVDPERKEGYRKYLINFCEFPKGWGV